MQTKIAAVLCCDFLIEKVLDGTAGCERKVGCFVYLSSSVWFRRDSRCFAA
ncbi:hypothetical protein STRDD11_00463 [Streptococcus sp. DD11]|nr:hypothetical protein STRDD11_00463 [Streptococcus sp. DD11]